MRKSREIYYLRSRSKERRGNGVFETKYTKERSEEENDRVN